MDENKELFGEYFLTVAEEAYWEWDVPRKTFLLSERVHSLLGFETGKSSESFEEWLLHFHPNEREQTRRDLIRVADGHDAAMDATVRMETRSRSWKWISCKARPVVVGSDGSVLRIAGTNSDVTTMKALESSLIESESRWESLVNNSPAGICVISPHGTVLFASRNHPFWEKGIPVGRDVEGFLTEDNRPTWKTILRFILQSRHSLSVEWWLDTKAGRRIWENRLAPVVENDQLTSLIIVGFDVSERNRMERKIQLELTRSRLLSDLEQGQDLAGAFPQQAMAAIQTLTQSPVVLYLRYDENAEILRLSRYLLPESSRFDFEGPALGRKSLAPLSNSLSTRTFLMDNSSDVELPWENFPRLRRFLSVPIFEWDRIVALVVVGNKPDPYEDDELQELQLLLEGSVDLFERIRIQDENRKLSLAVENSPASILITDGEGIVEYANPQACQVSGFTSQEMIGKPTGGIPVEENSPEIFEKVLSTLKSGNKWRGELRNRKKNGDEFWEQVSISPLFNEHGEIVHYIDVREDITERKATEKSLLQMQKMESIGQLTAGIAHDFNNLLTSLLNFNAMLLRKMPAQDPLRIYAEKIQTSGGKASDLVTSLLAFGRKQDLKKKKVDLSDVVVNNVVLLKALLPKGVVLKVDFEKAPLTVEIDESQITQVLMNLVGNARDALEGSGDIGLGTRRRKVPTDGFGQTRLDPSLSYATFWVSDDGPGIPEAIKGKLFEPFFTTKEVGKGTGLGLAVVFGIVEQHHGAIEVETEEGQGTLFRVWLPLAEGTQDPPPV